jgi:hypothetical protein
MLRSLALWLSLTLLLACATVEAQTTTATTTDPGTTAAVTTTGAPATTTVAATTTTAAPVTSAAPVTTTAPAGTTLAPSPTTTATSTTTSAATSSATATASSGSTSTVIQITTIAPTTRTPNVTTPEPTAPTNLTEPPLSTNVSVELSLRAAIRLSGSSWNVLLNDEVRRYVLSQAFAADIAGLLGVNSSSIIVLDMRPDPIIITFGVTAGSGRTGSQLVARFATAGSSTRWLINTVAAYRQVASDAISVLSTGIAYAATPSPESLSAASGVWRWPALAAVTMVLIALL